jgi:hypothetical protein
VLCLAMMLSAGAVRAQGGSPLVLEASQELGRSTPTTPGWFTLSVLLQNNGDAEIEGTLELRSELAWSRSAQQLVSRAPFAIAGKSAARIELPTRGFGGPPPSLKLRALDLHGRVIAEQTLPDPQAEAPLLFDLTVPSRIAPEVRGRGLDVSAPSSARYGVPTLAVGSPSIDAATGQPVLPERAAGYSPATVVLARSDVLAKLKGPELDALGDWVLAGGTLAVVVTRPEDLHGATLSALVGGAVQATDAPASLKAPAVFRVVPDTSGSSPPYGSAPSAGSTITESVAPAPGIAKLLVGYAGGNLHDSPWGASASYGLGEVHLLAFDATREPFVSDPWVKLKTLALVEHSWNRSVSIALPFARTSLDAPEVSQVRRVLDPNEGSRWAVAVAALLLLAYAMLAGPFNFLRASAKGRPLSALVHLPVWAAGTMAIVVGLGVVAKGLTGQARHLTLVEAGAGMSRAAATRFRAFYTSSSAKLTVRATERADVLDVAGASNSGRALVVDRDGARLANFQSEPWQTVLVREDGFISLAGGISIVADPDGEVEVTNRTAHDLLGVLLKVPGGDVVYFPRIRDGARVLASKGEKVPGHIGGAWLSGSITAHRLDAAEFAPTIDADASGAGAAWEAFEGLASRDTDWWPSDVPVLLAELDGGEGRMSDSGLELTVDRVLVRVVGYGGVR